jgi:Zn ribbon nucleic-acid-binding protein
MIECPECRVKSLNKDDHYSVMRCRLCGYQIHYRRIDELKRELTENGFFQMANPILSEFVYYPLLRESFDTLNLIKCGSHQYLIADERGKRSVYQILIKSKETLNKGIEELENVIVSL